MVSGVSIPTIRQGIKEIQTGQAIENGRVRKVGGGQKRVEDIYPEILEKIKEIVDEAGQFQLQSALYSAGCRVGKALHP